MDVNTDTVTLGIVVSRLDDIKEDIGGIRTELADFKRETVGRGEWVQRNNHVDERFRHTDDKFSGQGREIAQLRTDVNSKRAPWWSVAAVLIAAAAFIYPILERIP